MAGDGVEKFAKQLNMLVKKWCLSYLNGLFERSGETILLNKDLKLCGQNRYLNTEMVI